MARLGIEGLKRKLSELQGVIDEAADDKLRGDHHLKLCKLSRALHEGVSALPSTATGVGALPPRRGALGGGVSYFKRTRFLVQRNCDHKAVRILGDGASRGIHIPLHLCFRRTSDEGRPRIAALDVTVVTIKKALRPHTMRVLA